MSSAAWEDLVGVADELTVVAALWGALRSSGLEPPPDISAFLRRQHAWNAARNLAFVHGLKMAVSALQVGGITPVLFKGSLSLVDGTVTDLGWRWMADLDVVVPEEALFDAVDRLHAIGFKTLPPGYHGPHELVVAHRDMQGAIELHVSLGGEPAASVLPIDDVVAASRSVAFAGGTVRALSPTHQVLHSIVHSAIHDHNHTVGGLPLRQLLTLADLLRAHGSAVDWDEIEARSSRHGLRRAVRAHLWLGHRLLGIPLPPGQRGSVSARVHEQRVVANFVARWPAVVHRNLIEALRREHLEALYQHGDRPLARTGAAVRHLAQRVRGHSWADNKGEALKPRT
jgi:hypothetical protein